MWLVDPGLEKQISTIDEMMSSKLEFGVEEMYEYFLNKYFEGVDYDKSRLKACDGLRECFYRTMKYRNQATFTADIFAENVAAMNFPNQVFCSISDKERTLPIVFMFTENTMYQEPFNTVIRIFIESGIIPHRAQSFRDQLRRLSKNEEFEKEFVEYFVFELYHMFAAFAIFISGLVLASLVFVAEIIVFHTTNNFINVVERSTEA